MRKSIVIVLILLNALQAFSQDNLDVILKRLDQLIENRQVFIEERQQQIEVLYKLKDGASEIAEQYTYARQLQGLFLPYHIDSAMHYASECARLAIRHPESSAKVDAQLLLTQSYLLAGMYHEAGELLKAIDVESMPVDMRQFYYTLQHTRYRYLHSYLTGSDLSLQYEKLSKAYQDSLLLLVPQGNTDFQLAKAEQLRDYGELGQSKELLLDELEKLSPENHSYAYTAYTLSTVYQAAGDLENQKKYLALSAESDVRCAVRENAAIRELAVLLYQAGDIDRAYNYIKLALDDALFSKARLRSLEILQILPVIDQAYMTMREQKRKNMFYFSGLSISLSLFLLIALIGIQRQKRKLKWANAEIKSKNKQFEDANDQLKEQHQQIADINKLLSSSNQLQEEYIGKYLKLCSSYIGKMDRYRQTIHKKATMGSKEDLLKLLKSKEMIDKELQAFYHDFDTAFLELYPGFVKQFNALLREDEQIVLKADEKLNTELRIFALIRIGITESPQIATFLRYSVTTIYNYRTKVRNKSRVPREDFEDLVMKLGNLN